MRNLLRKLYLYILGAMQARCQHPAEFVCADILEGDVNGLSVQWCKVCGATRIMRPSTATFTANPFGRALAGFAAGGGLLGGLGGRPARFDLTPRAGSITLPISIPVGEWRRPEPQWISDPVEAEREEAA